MQYLQEEEEKKEKNFLLLEYVSTRVLQNLWESQLVSLLLDATLFVFFSFSVNCTDVALVNIHEVFAIK